MLPGRANAEYPGANLCGVPGGVTPPLHCLRGECAGIPIYGGAGRKGAYPHQGVYPFSRDIPFFIGRPTFGIRPY